MANVGCTLEPVTFDSAHIKDYLAAMEDLRFNTYRSARNNLSLFLGFVQETYQIGVDQPTENV
jgi:hypothetical protein